MTTRLKKFVLQIKEHNIVFTWIGIAFFLIALFIGTIWLSTPDNKELEPTTFILMTISSIFLGAPTLTEIICPTPKPLRHMTYDEILDYVCKTDSHTDWAGIDLEFVEERFLKEDPRLRISTKFIDDGIHSDDFREVWANSHPDRHASSYYYTLLYDGNFIHRIVLVHIDGGRATLPLPDIQTAVISDRLSYKIAQIFDSTNTLDSYIHRSHLTLQLNN